MTTPQRAAYDRRILHLRKISGPVERSFRRLFKTLNSPQGRFQVGDSPHAGTDLQTTHAYLRGVFLCQLNHLPSDFIDTLSPHMAQAFFSTPTEACNNLLTELVRTYINQDDYEGVDEFVRLISYY